MSNQLQDIMPFEICSIRPPTENYSLTFRLTRNCYWNKCAFCPVYKFGAKFSKRTTETVIEDIRRAGLIDDILHDEGIIRLIGEQADYDRLEKIIDSIEQSKGFEGETPEADAYKDLDERLAWFLPWFKETPCVRDSIQHVLSWRMGGARTCFLGDADSLILDPAFMAEVIRSVKDHFPSIDRFTVYGRTRSAARLRTLEELEGYHAAGLHRVHFGIESGCDEVLSFMNKGVTRAEHIDGLAKTKDSGISCSVYVMPGLGGKGLSESHAHDTAGMISRAAPDFVRLRSLQIFPQTPLEEAVRKGAFMEADEEDLVREIRTMVQEIDCVTEIMSDSASNLLDISGSLPTDRKAMLEEVDAYLALPHRERLLFSLQSRVSSFMGQYGGLSRDIHAALAPFIKGGRLDPADAPDDDIRAVIKLIRSRLMP
jgi:hypothetical protein